MEAIGCTAFFCCQYLVPVVECGGDGGAKSRQAICISQGRRCGLQDVTRGAEIVMEKSYDIV